MNLPTLSIAETRLTNINELVNAILSCKLKIDTKCKCNGINLYKLKYSRIHNSVKYIYGTSQIIFETVTVNSKLLIDVYISNKIKNSQKVLTVSSDNVTMFDTNNKKLDIDLDVILDGDLFQYECIGLNNPFDKSVLVNLIKHIKGILDETNN